MARLWLSRVFAVALLIGLSTTGTADADVDALLYNAISNCWDAVDKNSPDALSNYEMRFEGLENPSPQAENYSFSGTARTDLGEIDISVLVRNGMIIDCTLQTYPEPPGANLISFDEAMDTTVQWHSETLRDETTFETMTDVRFLGLVRCRQGGPSVVFGASTLGLPETGALQLGSDATIPGNLRVGIFLSHPRNHKSCSSSSL